MTAVGFVRRLKGRVAGLLADRSGVTAAEYAILAVGIVIVVGVAVMAYDAYSPMQIAGNAILSGQTSLAQSPR